MSIIISLLVFILIMSGWLWGQKKFPITDAEGTPVKGRYFRAIDEAGNRVKAVIWRDRYLFDSMTTGIFSLSNAALWVLGAEPFAFLLLVTFLPWSAWLLWKGLRAPKRPVPV